MCSHHAEVQKPVTIRALWGVGTSRWTSHPHKSANAIQRAEVLTCCSQGPSGEDGCRRSTSVHCIQWASLQLWRCFRYLLHDIESHWVLSLELLSCVLRHNLQACKNVSRLDKYEGPRKEGLVNWYSSACGLENREEMRVPPMLS